MPTTTPPGGSATCAICRKPATDRPRVKDKKGRYYHKDCYQKAKQKLQARKQAQSGAPRRPKPAAPAAASESSLMDDMLALESSAPAIEAPMAVPTAQPLSATAAAASVMCPGCGSTLPPGARICVSCGLDIATGKKKKMAKARKAKAKGGGSASSGEGIVSQSWFLGACATVFFVVFALIARGNPDMEVAYSGVAMLFAAGIGIWVLISAFGESTTHGILCLCLPIYSLYYVLAVNNDNRLKLAYAAANIAYLLILTMGDGLAEFGDMDLGDDPY